MDISKVFSAAASAICDELEGGFPAKAAHRSTGQNSNGQHEGGGLIGGFFSAVATFFAPSEDPKIDHTRGYAQAMGHWKPGAIAGGDPRLDDAEKSLRALLNYFDYLDNGGDLPPEVQAMLKFSPGLKEVCADGRITMSTLQSVANDPNAPLELRKAAQFMYSNQDMMKALDVAGNLGLKDGDFTLGNLEVMLDRVIQAKKEPPPVLTAPPTATPPGVSGNSTPSNAGKSDKPLGGERADNDSGKTPKTPKTGGAKGNTAEEIILNAVDKNEAAYLELVRKVFDDESLSPSESYKLQILMTQRQEMQTLLANMSRAFHDMSMTSIGHIR